MRRLSRSLLHGRSVGLALGLFGFLAFLGFRTDHYLTKDNLIVVFLQVTTMAILALGAAWLLIGSNIDLSMGSLYAMGAIVAAMSAKAVPPLAAIAIGVGVTTVLGFANGLLVWRINISPIIITLGSLTLIRAFVLLLTNGQSVRDVPEAFQAIGSARPLGIPMPVWLFVFLAITMSIVLAKTTTGRYTYAIGANRDAAAMSGINIRRLVLGAFAFNGMLAGLAGAMTASRFGTATPQFGEGLELLVMSAVILGGVSFAGGKGGLGGVILAVFFLGVIRSGIVALGLNPYYADVLLGGSLIVAVFLDQVVGEQREKRLTKAAMKRAAELEIVRGPGGEGAGEAIGGDDVALVDTDTEHT